MVLLDVAPLDWRALGLKVVLGLLWRDGFEVRTAVRGEEVLAGAREEALGAAEDLVTCRLC